MKKVFVFLLASALLFTSCKAGKGSAPISSSVAEASSSVETGSMVEGETSGNETNSSGEAMTDEEVYKIFSALDEKALPVLYWYWADTSEDLGIATESTHAPYYKVSKFSTIDEMKSATNEIFTGNFSNEYFYDHAFVDSSGSGIPMYQEIDGELYRNQDMGGIGWPYHSMDEYYIPYQDDKMIVIAVKTTMIDGEIRWFNHLLKNENGVWKLDAYYDFNPYMEYSNTFPVQRQKEIGHAVSSWFCVQDWTDANQLDANALINFYLYTYLSDVEEEYDYEQGYKVPAADVMEGLSTYFNNLKKETLIAVNQNEYANARYDTETDSFYFDITFDGGDYIVIDSKNQGNITTLELMVIGKDSRAGLTSFLDLEVNDSGIKFVGNKRGKELAAE